MWFNLDRAILVAISLLVASAIGCFVREASPGPTPIPSPSPTAAAVATSIVQPPVTPVHWEGLVRLTGSHSGWGFVELVGYSAPAIAPR